MKRLNQTQPKAFHFLFLFVACILVSNVTAYNPFSKSIIKKPTELHIDQPVTKSFKRPLLVVVDPLTKSRIHLVGVSHGSASSANLVQEVMSEIPNPAAVVLELCLDRYFSISLDSKIRPRDNESLAMLFDVKLGEIADAEAKKKASFKGLGLVTAFSQLKNTLRFVSGQGLIGGTFVLLGLFVSDLQRMTRSNTGGDEFVTAMIEAERLNIPIRLGDAPQNDTLNSIKKVMSRAVFEPEQVMQGAGLLAFSALGLLPDASNKALSQRIPESVMKASQWVNIPQAYIDNKQMLKSLYPLLLAALLTTSIGLLPNDIDVSSAASLNSLGTSASIATQFTLPALMTSMSQISLFDPLTFDVATIQASFLSLTSLLFRDLSPEVEAVTTTIADMISILVLIRMAKIIGSDRDRIIAKNIQAAALEFPGQDIVVVIGMLHCNGVARWLLSGVDPMTFNYSAEVQK